MIGVVDYGAGNLQSVVNALDRLELASAICREPGDLERVERILLPGVGHFGAAARRLDASGMARAIVRRVRDSRTPLLGICLGLQLLLDGSDEAPTARGLGLIPGRAERMRARVVPHMGWNRVCWAEGAPAAASDGDYFYFAHEYVARPLDAAHALATVDVENDEVVVAIGEGAVLGVQFHPEKSDRAGLELLAGFGRC